ncbi:MAG: hypothetical protein ABI702_13310 [Burkholderiales bacterium]
MKLLSTIAIAAALSAASFASLGETATKHAKKATKPAATAAASAEPAAASPAQLAAAERVYYGTYNCDLAKTVEVSTLPKFPGYAELRFGKSVYVMKPIESTTGAIRLEDVKGETLVVQIAAKSMLLNVKTGQRILDGCVNEKQGKVASAS